MSFVLNLTVLYTVIDITLGLSHKTIEHEFHIQTPKSSNQKTLYNWMVLDIMDILHKLILKSFAAKQSP